MKKEISPFFLFFSVLIIGEFKKSPSILEVKMMHYVCPICGNKDQTFVGFMHGKPYCRKCVVYRGDIVKDEPSTFDPGAVVLDLKYSLTKEQKEISDKLIENYKKHIDSLIFAVCGAGKTELIYGVICYALVHHHKVGFALPRRDVAIELFARFKSAFIANTVQLVIGGHHRRLEADIVICTTHQLFRYSNYFDLLILDEIDAFPYRGDTTLENIFLNAVKGSHIVMSATVDEKTLKRYESPGHSILTLNVRYHHHPLPVPKVELCTEKQKFKKLVDYLGRFIKEEKPVFIFAPTIKLCEELYEKLKKIYPGGHFVHSQVRLRATIIKGFKNGHYDYLVTTAVLERGVTVRNLQVIVYGADNIIYDDRALIQIAGRVGRKYDAFTGEVIFLATDRTAAIEKSIKEIREKNKYLSVM